MCATRETQVPVGAQEGAGTFGEDKDPKVGAGKEIERNMTCLLHVGTMNIDVGFKRHVTQKFIWLCQIDSLFKL